MPAYEQDLQKILARLKRIEGQVRGVQRMVSEGQYCVDVLTQISSISRATEKVGLIILRDHIHGCVRESIAKDDAEKSIEELVGAVERFLRT